MSATTIERKIGYDMAGGSATDILTESINVSSFALFSLQVFVTDQAGGVNGVLTLRVSNDGIEFKSIAKTAVMNVLGTGTYYIFVGTSEGFSAVTHIQLSFTANAVNAGTIDKAIFMGNLGNS